MVPFDTFLVITLLIFVYCYYGNRVTVKPIQFAQAAYDTPWYVLSAQRQQFINMMIMYGQYELYYSGYGVVICSLEMFGKVID